MQKLSSTLESEWGHGGVGKGVGAPGHSVEGWGLHVKHTAQVISNAYKRLRTTINTMKILLLAKERKPLLSLRSSFTSPSTLISSSYKYTHTPSTPATLDLSSFPECGLKVHILLC